MQNQNNQIKDVLFQKLGNSWYAFAEVNNEVVFSPLPEGIDPRNTKIELYSIIEEHLKRSADQKPGRPVVGAA